MHARGGYQTVQEPPAQQGMLVVGGEPNAAAGREFMGQITVAATDADGSMEIVVILRPTRGNDNLK